MNINLNLTGSNPYYALDLPVGWRQTDSIGGLMSDDLLTISNYVAVMATLRALDGVVEGDHGDWYEENGRICYRCPLSDKQFARAIQRGYVDADDEPCAVLDALLEIKEAIKRYPVLDEDDFARREYEAECAFITDEARIPLTEDQIGMIHRYLGQYSSPPDDPNHEGCPAEYQVEWSGSDYHTNRDRDLKECVQYAITALGYNQPDPESGIIETITLEEVEEWWRAHENATAITFDTSQCVIAMVLNDRDRLHHYTVMPAIGFCAYDLNLTTNQRRPRYADYHGNLSRDLSELAIRFDRSKGDGEQPLTSAEIISLIAEVKKGF